MNERKGAAVLACVLVVAAVASWLICRRPAAGVPEGMEAQSCVQLYGAEEEAPGSVRNGKGKVRSRDGARKSGRRKGKSREGRGREAVIRERDILSDTIPTTVSPGIGEEDCP